MAEPMHLYSVFGLTIASTLELPELLPPLEDGPPDVRIVAGNVPKVEDAPSGLSIHEGGALLNIPDVGRYWIADGREILVQPNASASERNVRLFLLGSALGAILHQRALLPLHANAIVLEGRAVAFMGHPGAGKSTMAGWFHDRGYPVLADDVCVVTPGPDGAPLAHPGLPRLRLWREAMEAAGRSVEGLELSFDDMDKYNLPIGQEVRRPVPLSHVYLLEQAGEGVEQGGVTPLRGVEAVDALVANTYRGTYLPLMGGTARHLMACVDLARRLPVFTARRAWGFDRFDAEAQRLEAHALGVIRTP
jgi:hypothetical protein